MLPFFAWKIFSISFFISLDFYLQVLFVSSVKRFLIHIIYENTHNFNENTHILL